MRTERRSRLSEELAHGESAHGESAQGESAEPPRRPWPASWPPAARETAEQLFVGLWRVRRSAEQDDAGTAEALGEAIGHLARHGGMALALQANMIRDLLERAYPDGFTGRSVQEVLVRCAGAASELMDDEGLMEDLALVVGGAIGMSEEFGESASPRVAARFLRSGLLVLDDLLAHTGLDAGLMLETSMGEIWRSETMEMP